MLQDDAELGEFPKAAYPIFVVLGNTLQAEGYDGRVYGVGKNTTSNAFLATYPTVNQWLKKNNRVALLRAGSQIIYVAFGQIVESLGFLPRHKKVTHVIYLSEVEDAK